MDDLASRALRRLSGREPPRRRSANALFFGGVTLGLVIGGLVTLLTIPRSGQETRAELRATIGILLEPLSEAVANARAQAERAAAEAEQEVLRRYEAIKAGGA